MQSGPQLVYDCSFDKQMSKIEFCTIANQLTMSFHANRKHHQPFGMHLCSVDFSSNMMQQLLKNIPTLLSSSFPMQVHQEDLVKAFPRERIVYLTPHSREDLHEYNPEDIYVIPAYAAMSGQPPFCLAKAKKLELRTARLPINRHLQWVGGHGVRTPLNQLTSILLDVKSTGDWSVAMQNIPKRKLIQATEYRRQEMEHIAKQRDPFHLPDVTHLRENRRNPFRKN